MQRVFQIEAQLDPTIQTDASVLAGTLNHLLQSTNLYASLGRYAGVWEIDRAPIKFTPTDSGTIKFTWTVKEGITATYDDPPKATDSYKDMLKETLQAVTTLLQTYSSPSR